MKNILIRGKPGSGKTTLVIRIVNLLKGKTTRERVVSTGGFYTEEIRADKDRKGFKVKTLNGEEGILSHVHAVKKKAPPELSNWESVPRVGRYRINLNAIDELIVNSIEEAIRDKDIVIIDEIGKMEMFSENFKSAVKNALDSPKRVLATIPVYSNSFLESIKARDDIEIFDLDVDNRDRLLKDILHKLE